MPIKWQWWSTPLTCGFCVNSSSLLPREITLPLVNTLFLLVLPSFQFVLYSSLQRLFSLFCSPRKSFLCLFLHLSLGVESSQESLRGHCHAAREAVCELCYWSPASCSQESGKEKWKPNPGWFLYHFIRFLFLFDKQLCSISTCIPFSVMCKHLLLKQQDSCWCKTSQITPVGDNTSLVIVSNCKSGEYQSCAYSSGSDVKNFAFHNNS